MINKLKSIVLSSMILATVAFSYGNIENENNARENLDISQYNNSVCLNDFELFDRDIQLIRLNNDFGRIEQNFDKAYVRSGDYSLKVNPLGRRDLSLNPFIVLPTYSMNFEELSYSDFTKVDSITMWAYNDTDKEVKMGVGFSRGGIRINYEHHKRRDEMKKTYCEFYYLKPGWNFIEYEVRQDLLKMQEIKIDEVTGVALEFDYVKSHKLKDSPTIYIDDVNIHYNETEKDSTFKKSVTKGKTAEGKDYWSVADFETTEEGYYMCYHYEYPCTESCQPVMDTAFAGDFGIKAKSGTQVFVLTEKPGDSTYGWPSINVAGDVMRNVFNEIGDDIIQHPENYAFKCDIFNPNDVTCSFSVDFEGKRTWSSVNALPHQWGAYSITFDKVNSSEQSIMGWKDNGNGPEPILSGVEKYTEKVGYVNFLWSRYYKESNEDRILLFDNIRIEKIK